MANEDLEIHVEEQGNIAIFELIGSLVSPNDIDGISIEMRGNDKKHAVVVLDEVSYINSSGFSSLIVLADILGEFGKKLYIVGLRKKVQVVFDSLGASDILKTFPTLREALRDIRYLS